MSRNNGNYVDLLLLLDDKAIRCEQKPHLRSILKHKYHIENVMLSALVLSSTFHLSNKVFWQSRTISSGLWLCVVVHVSAKMYLLNVFFIRRLSHKCLFRLNDSALLLEEKQKKKKRQRWTKIQEWKNSGTDKDTATIFFSL